MRLMYRNLRFSVLVLFAISLLSVSNAAAHSPSSMTLEYNTDSQVLTVTVSHGVSDVETHYIDEIQIQKNGTAYTSRTYSSQDTTSGMSDTFIVDAVAGDVLRVTAICSIAGSIVRELTVPSDTAPTDTNTTPVDMTVPILAAIIGLGLVAIVIFFLRKR